MAIRSSHTGAAAQSLVHQRSSRSRSASGEHHHPMSDAEQELGGVDHKVQGVQQRLGHEVAEERYLVEQLEHEGPSLGSLDCSPFGQKLDWGELLSGPAAGLGLMLVCFGAAWDWPWLVVAGLALLCWVAWR